MSKIKFYIKILSRHTFKEKHRKCAQKCAHQDVQENVNQFGKETSNCRNEIFGCKRCRFELKLQFSTCCSVKIFIS